MMTDALLAYFHYVAIFLLFAFLTVEAMILRVALDAHAVRLLGRVDRWYFAGAMLVLVSGLSRIFWGAKGAVFYSANPIFYTKIVLFIAIGILSIPPTIQFIRWSKRLVADAPFEPDALVPKQGAKFVATGAFHAGSFAAGPASNAAWAAFSRAKFASICGLPARYCFGHRICV